MADASALSPEASECPSHFGFKRRSSDADADVVVYISGKTIKGLWAMQGLPEPRIPPKHEVYVISVKACDQAEFEVQTAGALVSKFRQVLRDEGLDDTRWREVLLHNKTWLKTQPRPSGGGSDGSGGGASTSTAHPPSTRTRVSSRQALRTGPSDGLNDLGFLLSDQARALPPDLLRQLAEHLTGIVQQQADDPTGAQALLAPARVVAQPLLLTKQERIEWVRDVMLELNEVLPEKDKFAFDIETCVRLVIEGHFIVALGLCQGGKSGIVLCAILCTLVEGVPCMLMMCEVMYNAEDLREKLKSMLDKLADLPTYRDTPQARLQLHSLCNNRSPPASVLDAFQRGQAVLVLSYTAAQIKAVHRAVQSRGNPELMVIMDEADNMWTSQRLDTLGRIERERAFYDLVGMFDATTKRFSGLYGMMQVTATPLPCLFWHYDWSIPVRCVKLERDTLKALNYIGEDKLRPFSPGGQPMFLESISRKNNYGVHIGAISSYDNEGSSQGAPSETEPEDFSDSDGCEVIKLLDAVEQLRVASVEQWAKGEQLCSEADQLSDAGSQLCRKGARYQEGRKGKGTRLIQEGQEKQARAARQRQKGEKLQRETKKFLYVLDMANPYATTDDSVYERAKFLALRYPEWYFVAVSGSEGIKCYKVVNGVVQAPIERSLSHTTIQNFMERFDRKPLVPVCLLGYHMMRRCVSVRTHLRVPTHAVCAPTNGINLANMLQMIGRAFGRSLVTLALNGFEFIVVLMREHDFRSVLQANEFQLQLAQRMEAVGEGIRDVSQWLSETFPAELQAALGSQRKLGNRKTAADALFRRARFASATEQDEDLEADTTLDALLESISCNNVELEVLMVLELGRQHGKSQWLVEDIRQVDEELGARLRSGHQEYLTTLSMPEPGAALNSARKGLVRRCAGPDRSGLWELTVLGQKYMERRPRCDTWSRMELLVKEYLGVARAMHDMED